MLVVCRRRVGMPNFLKLVEVAGVTRPSNTETL